MATSANNATNQATNANAANPAGSINNPHLGPTQNQQSSFNPANSAYFSDPKIMLEVFIYDYMLKNKYVIPAKAFLEATKLDSTNVKLPFDTPSSFIKQWFFVFWELFKTKAVKPVPFDPKKLGDFSKSCLAKSLTEFNKTNGAPTSFSQKDAAMQPNSQNITKANQQGINNNNSTKQQKQKFERSNSASSRRNSSTKIPHSPPPSSDAIKQSQNSNHQRSRTNSQNGTSRTVKPPTSITLPQNNMQSIKPSQATIPSRTVSHASPQLQNLSQGSNSQSQYVQQTANISMPNIDYNALLSAQMGNANMSRPPNATANNQQFLQQQRSRQAMMGQNPNGNMQYMTPQMGNRPNPQNPSNPYMNNQMAPGVMNGRMMMLHGQTPEQLQQQGISPQQLKDTQLLARRQILEQQQINAAADNTKRMRMDSNTSPQAQFNMQGYMGQPGAQSQNIQHQIQNNPNFTQQQLSNMYLQNQQRMMQQQGQNQNMNQYANPQQQYAMNQNYQNYLNQQQQSSRPPNQRPSPANQSTNNPNPQQQYKNMQQPPQPKPNTPNKQAAEPKPEQNNNSQEAQSAPPTTEIQQGYNNMSQPTQQPNNNRQESSNNANDFLGGNSVLAEFDRYINTDDLDSYYNYTQQTNATADNRNNTNNNPGVDSLGSLMGSEPFDRNEFYQ